MATVAELVEHITRVASLNTSNTTEQALVLRWANDAYQRAVGRSGVSTAASATVSPSAASTKIARTAYTPANSAVNTVVNVYLNASGAAGYGRRLERVALDEIAELRNSTTTTTYDGPLKFFARTNGDIELWPVTATGNTFTIEMELQPPTLVSSAPGAGQESTPSIVPPMFHYDVLANYAISRALEYRGLESRAGYFRNAAESGMRELREWINEQGGIMGPQVKVLRNNTQATQIMPDQAW